MSKKDKAKIMKNSFKIKKNICTGYTSTFSVGSCSYANKSVHKKVENNGSFFDIHDLFLCI